MTRFPLGPYIAGRLIPITVFERGKETPAQAFLPRSLPPRVLSDPIRRAKLLGEIADQLVEASQALARLDGRASRLDSANVLLNPFLNREARLSSQIENTIATPREIALTEAGQEFERTDPFEVVNYKFAVEHGVKSELPLSQRLLKLMHEILLASSRGQNKRRGEYRQHQYWIGTEGSPIAGARYVPPPAGQLLQRSMDQFELHLNAPPPGVNSILHIACCHYQFEAIHPFEDGNGRLGRVLIALMLCRYQLLARPFVYLSAYFEQHREQYYEKLLRVTTHGEWKQWFEFFLEAVRTQAIDADERVDRLLALWADYADKVTDSRRSSLLRKLVDHLFGKQVITVPQAREVLGVEDTAARGHVNELVQLGILDSAGSVGRTKYYIASEILKTVDS